MNTVPERGKNREMIDQTQIHIKHFEKAQLDTLPQSWKLWELQTSTQSQSYEGATHDTPNMNINPIQDIIQWDREAAMLGYLPDTFKSFLTIIGIPKHKHKTTTETITRLLRDHTYTIFKKYWKVTKESTQIEETDTVPNTKQPTHNNTQELRGEEEAEDMEWLLPSEDEESTDSD